MKKQFILLIFIIFIFAGIIGYIYRDDFFKKFDNKNNDNQSAKPNKDDNDPYKEYKAISYFKIENLNRYIEYNSKNENLTLEQVITYVNIGLDHDFYSYIGKTDMSKGILILTNKYLKLEENYEPDDLETIDSEYFISANLYVRKMRKEAREAFEKLSADSISNGTPVYGQSGYREYSKQVSLYNSAVNQMGVAKADNDTARPGHSEHQTGLTIDVSSTKAGNMLSFDKTASFTWMQNNAHKYGFILRYPKGYENIHGFMYESWHYRYVGVEVATDMHDNYPTLTYDEYYYRFIDNKKQGN